ncbi:MAG: TolC family outer membrane protein [Gammaproteobacteria bacterium]|nr:TolC family outer membrane protein [Gammaproteobacteria bacterium]
MRHAPLVSLIVGVCISVAAASTPARAENLLDIYRLAQESDPAWAAAQADYRANIEKGPQGRALLLPAVIFTANAIRNSLNESEPGPFSSSYLSHGYTLQLTQPLYQKSSFAAYAEGKLEVTQAQAQLAIARQNLIVRTARAYFNVLAAQDTLRFAKAKEKAINGQLQLAERNFEVGNSTIVDVNAAQAQYDSAVAAEVVADNKLRVERETLYTITGMPVGTLATLTNTLPLQLPVPENMGTWTRAAEDQSPRIKVEQQAVAIAKEDVQRIRAGHYPSLDLIASTNYSNGNSPGFPGTIIYHSNLVGVELQWPIFSGGAISSEVRQSLAREDGARQNLTQTERQTVLKTRQYYLAVTSGVAQVTALEQALAASKKALESTELGYRTGVNTGLDVLNAQQNLFSVENDLSQAKYTYLMSKLELKDAVGTLSESDLISINRLLTGQ